MAAVPADMPLQDLDDWLARRETAVGDVRPGTEKIIRWHAGKRAVTPLAVVYIHGFSSSRQETAPLAERVCERLGANLFYTRLSGHGRDGRAMLQGTPRNWWADVEEAWAIGERLGERVVIMAVSTGATLATWFAAVRRPPRLAGMVFIAPNFGLRNRAAYRAQRWWNRLLLRWREWRGQGDFHFQPLNQEQARYWTCRYPLRAMAGMVRAIRLVDRLDLGALRTPVQMIYSPLDQVVDAAAIAHAFERWGAALKQQVPFEGSTNPNQHVIAGDIMSPTTTDAVRDLMLDFLEALPGEDL